MIDAGAPPLSTCKHCQEKGAHCEYLPTEAHPERTIWRPAMRPIAEPRTSSSTPPKFPPSPPSNQSQCRVERNESTRGHDHHRYSPFPSMTPLHRRSSIPRYLDHDYQQSTSQDDFTSSNLEALFWPSPDSLSMYTTSALGLVNHDHDAPTLFPPGPLPPLAPLPCKQDSLVWGVAPTRQPSLAPSISRYRQDSILQSRRCY